MISIKPRGYYGRKVNESRLARYLRQGLPSAPEGPGAIQAWGAVAGGGQAGIHLPVCVIPPSVAFSPAGAGPSVGGTASGNMGVWDTSSLTRRWLADGAPIVQPALSWTIPPELLGAALVLEVTGTNSDGPTVASTTPLTILPA